MSDRSGSRARITSVGAEWRPSTADDLAASVRQHRRRFGPGWRRSIRPEQSSEQGIRSVTLVPDSAWRRDRIRLARTAIGSTEAAHGIRFAPLRFVARGQKNDGGPASVIVHHHGPECTMSEGVARGDEHDHEENDDPCGRHAPPLGESLRPGEEAGPEVLHLPLLRAVEHGGRGQARRARQGTGGRAVSDAGGGGHAEAQPADGPLVCRPCHRSIAPKTAWARWTSSAAPDGGEPAPGVPAWV